MKSACLFSVGVAFILVIDLWFWCWFGLFWFDFCLFACYWYFVFVIWCVLFDSCCFVVLLSVWFVLCCLTCVWFACLILACWLGVGVWWFIYFMLWRDCVCLLLVCSWFDLISRCIFVFVVRGFGFWCFVWFPGSICFPFVLVCAFCCFWVCFLILVLFCDLCAFLCLFVARVYVCCFGYFF